MVCYNKYRKLKKGGKNMDLFNENVLPSDICNGFYAGIGSFAAIVVLIVAYIILKKGKLSFANIASSFIDAIKLAVSVATLVTILFLNSGKTSIATLIVGLLAILEIASSLSNILKTIFENRFEKE